MGFHAHHVDGRLRMQRHISHEDFVMVRGYSAKKIQKCRNESRNPISQLEVADQGAQGTSKLNLHSARLAQISCQPSNRPVCSISGTPTRLLAVLRSSV